MFDQETQTPIPNAIVKILSWPDKKQLDKAVTDQDGRFLLLTDQLLLGRSSDFILSPSKNGFVFNPPQHLVVKDRELYTGEVLSQENTKAGLIYALPLQKESQSSTTVSQARFLLQFLINKLALPLAIFSAVLSTLTFMANQNKENLTIFIVASIIFLAQLYAMFVVRPSFGIVKDKNQNPLSSAQLRLYDAKRQSLIQTTLSNQSGQYAFLAKSGSYQLIANLMDFKPYLSRVMHLDEDSTLNLDVEMERG